MKPILMFKLEACPYCKEALQWMEQVKKTKKEYEQLEITIIDEKLQPDVANDYDYYYVPTYYVDDIKVHEGVATKEIITKVFDSALSD
ncbi:thioredoxin-like protein [Natranaerovirga pectinivora]|uniref:Thioredoxin-like protein n=1 Tax=Natranaerovirga pectinivora TaxID=682400 RepID=A0A4R3MI80_9FIRM|nr:thioredoxin family protein [Natranaerovirga pectinivora]TCT12986.1 thioredoxin-like protein [Natranaerovirga pectinivora]